MKRQTIQLKRRYVGVFSDTPMYRADRRGAWASGIHPGMSMDDYRQGFTILGVGRGYYTFCYWGRAGVA